MAINNPYIDKVKKHKNIINIVDNIYINKGKWNKYFNNNNKLILEIGTGLGNFFSREVQKNPEKNFLGMEIKYKRLYICAEKSLGNLNNYSNNSVRLKSAINKNISQNDLGKENTNFVMLKDFGENINKIFKENEISKSYIFFPDPWEKKKRWLKNRLLQEKFLNNLFFITKIGGKVIIKTDHFGYYKFIMEELKKTNWKIIKTSTDWESEQDFRNDETTEFQQLFRGQNIKINYIKLEK